MSHFLEQWRRVVAEHSERPALVHRDLAFTYAELDTRTRRIATKLQELGIEAGDRVALCLAEKLPLLLAHLGTLQAGGVSLPLNSRYPREELRFFLADSGAAAVVAGAEQRPILESLQSELPGLRHVLSVEQFDPSEAEEYREPALTVDSPCLLIYSSGTTGWPKGVLHTHGTLVAGLNALGRAWRFTPEDVVLNVLPLFHVHGLCFATHLPWLNGGCVVVDDFDPEQTLLRIADCSVFMAVPTIYYRFLEQRESFRAAARGWPRVRLFTCGSAPIRPEVLPDLEAILGKPVINRYGMTEGFVLTSLPLDGPWPQGSVGLPLDGVALRVADEQGAPAPVGSVGAVQVRGPNLFREYWKKPAETAGAFRDGWFDTGDLGSLDAAGFLTLAGRKNDLIITNGFNVYPPVVERVLNECPGVKESAIVGVPDSRRGERVVACVVRDNPALDLASLESFWNERLVDYQRPRQVVFFDTLPRNAMGKVVRSALRDQIGDAPA